MFSKVRQQNYAVLDPSFPTLEPISWSNKPPIETFKSCVLLYIQNCLPFSHDLFTHFLTSNLFTLSIHHTFYHSYNFEFHIRSSLKLFPFHFSSVHLVNSLKTLFLLSTFFSLIPLVTYTHYCAYAPQTPHLQYISSSLISHHYFGFIHNSLDETSNSLHSATQGLNGKADFLHFSSINTW